ncbi:MAG TPA: LPD38 domain-containing protein [Acetobacteraceae bacterium]|nr:LPD38 domain-containing protein [Acetobacteraceae bacterium]
MPSAVDDARAQGYSDAEINAQLAPDMAAARAQGYSQDEINAHYGIVPPPPFDDTALRQHISTNLATAPKPVTSFGDAVEAGLQMSATGLIARGKVPDKVLAEDAPWYSRIAANVASTVADLPEMGAGFLMGGALGSETGPGAAITATAGAFALPTALRSTLMDAYEKGQFTSFPDFWARASGIMIDTAKSYVAGAATGAAGAVAGPALEAALPALASPAVTAATKTAAEIATMTTVGKGLEGQVPSASDFLDAAVLLGGLKFADMGAGKLRSLYARTGIPPAAVIADAAHDVTISQDLLSDKEVPDAYRSAADADAARVAAEPGRAAEAADRAEASAEPQAAETDAAPPTEPGTPDASPLQREPPEPERLASFLKRMGGVQDPGGDIASTLGGARFRPGLINRNGLTQDDAALQAWEHGFFPEFGETRPPINDLLNALDEDLRGNNRYSSQDQGALEAYQEARGQNEQIVRLATEHGIDTTDMTREQFFDKVAERLSSDQVAEEAAKAADAHQGAYDEAERVTGQWLIAHGHPDDVDAMLGPPRTLEELEREFQQEQGSRPAGQGAGDGGQPGAAGGGAGGGADGGGPGGRGPGAATGGGEAGGEPAGGGPPTDITDARERILAHISVGETPPTRGWSWGRLYTNLFDKLFPISQAVSEASGGADVAAADNAYKLARLMAGVTGKANHMLDGAGTFDFNTYENTGPSLKAILAPHTENLDGLRAYIASRRALELEGRGIKTGFDLDAAQLVLDSGRAQYGDTAAALTDFQDRVAQYLRDSGVLSRAGYAAMREANQLYVPFQRVMDDVEGGGIRAAGSSLQARNPIHGMVGSERQVIDPIESIVRNTYLLTQMAEKNAVGTKLVAMLQGADEAAAAATPTPLEAAATVAELRAAGVESADDLAPMIAGSAPVKDGEIRVFRDGVAETWQVDPELARAMKGLDAQSMGMIEQILRPFSRTLRAGAVLQPDFVLRHSIRDFLYASVTHPGFFNPVDMARGFLSLARRDEDYQDWLKSGAANVSMVALDRQYMQTSIDQLAGTGMLERAWNVVGNPDASVLAKARAAGMTLPMDVARKFLLNPMQMAVEFAESATHIGTFIKAKNEMLAGQPEGTELTKAQIQEAGFASRDVAVDASMMGAKVQAWNSVSAFANIALQDSSRVVRSFIDRPMSTAIKVAGAISLPSALVWWNGKDDPRYKEAPDWQRDTFWVIPTDRWQDATAQDFAGQPDDPHLRRQMPDGSYQVNNGLTFRIPKPWGMGLIFGSGVERTLDGFYNHNPGAFANFGKSLESVSVPSLVPNAVVPVIEQFANRSTFFDRTLVPDQMEKYLPEYQYTPYTTETAKALGQLLGAFPGVEQAKTQQGAAGGVARALSSPILLENYLRAWTGNLGMYTLQLADAGLRKAGVVPDPPNQPESTLADIPFVRAFVVRSPSSSAQSIQDFQDDYGHNKIYYDTLIGMAKEGNMDAVRRVQAAGGPMTFVRLDGIHKAIQMQSTLVRDIYKNPDIPPDQKRQLIDTAYWRMIEIAQSGKAAMAQARAQLQGAPAQ